MLKQVLRTAFTGLQLQKFIFDTRPVDVRFMVDKLAMGQVFFWVYYINQLMHWIKYIHKLL